VAANQDFGLGWWLFVCWKVQNLKTQFTGIKNREIQIKSGKVSFYP